MDKFLPPLERRFFLTIILIIAIVFALFITANYLSLYQKAYTYTENNLKQLSQALDKDFEIKDGKLNSIAYYQDTSLPYDNTIYIITKDGFVIERSKHFTGLLDAADSSYALSFQQPQTIDGRGNEKWRMISKKIIRNNNDEGVILVAYNEPNLAILKDIDNTLIEDMNKVDSMIAIREGQLDISNINSRKIKYSTYYQVIDKYNHLLIDEGAPPSYIDKSYIADYIGKEKVFSKKDILTGETYLFYLQPLLKNEGFILVGKSIQDFQTVITTQRQFIIITSFLLLFIILILIIALRKELTTLVSRRVNETIKIISTPTYINPKRITLDIQNGILSFDDKEIQIEYGSRQSEFCFTLMSTPTKRWEQDEIVDKLMLHDDVHDRTFYDLRTKINRKVFPIIGKDFISYNRGRYFINSELASLILKPTKK